ncbi:MAG: response regulator transcription factor [Bacilli bacterium]|nr:response regulator transcription factor [Bacilli bacterium]
MRILVVEDEPVLADIVADSLKKEKYSVDVCYDGEEGEYNALSDIYNLIILDVMLPYKDGFEILKSIRENNIKAKVIMLTAKAELEDKLTGLEGGADDYITKPFHIEELLARVNIQLRKKAIKDDNCIEFDDLKLNLKTSNLMCTKSGESIDVGLKEFLLLEEFIRNPNIIISKDQIYDKVWGIDNISDSNNLEAYLSFVRKKIKIIGSRVQIKAYRGLGYKLEVRDEKVI